MDVPCYKKGDLVVYGNNGVCRIVDIKEMSFSSAAETTPHYVLSPIEGQSFTIFVPFDNEAALRRLRRVMTRQSIDSMLNSARDKSIEWIDSKNERAARFREIMKYGIKEELIVMMRCLYSKRAELVAIGKKLPSADEQLLKTAEQLVNNEFSCVLGIGTGEVGPYIRSSLGIAGNK